MPIQETSLRTPPTNGPGPTAPVAPNPGPTAPLQPITPEEMAGASAGIDAALLAFSAPLPLGPAVAAFIEGARRGMQAALDKIASEKADK